MVVNNNIFSHGSRWLRADFHLHTRADKEFSYSGDDDYYLSNYVDALEKAGVAVGLISNHNKFDFDEFKALRKSATKILPYRGIGSGIIRALKEYPYIDFMDDHDGNRFVVTVWRKE